MTSSLFMRRAAVLPAVLATGLLASCSGMERGRYPDTPYSKSYCSAPVELTTDSVTMRDSDRTSWKVSNVPPVLLSCRRSGQVIHVETSAMTVMTRDEQTRRPVMLHPPVFLSAVNEDGIVTSTRYPKADLTIPAGQRSAQEEFVFRATMPVERLARIQLGLYDPYEK